MVGSMTITHRVQLMCLSVRSRMMRNDPHGRVRVGVLEMSGNKPVGMLECLEY